MNGTLLTPAAPAGTDFKDRRTGLIVFGILEMVLGGLAALMIPLMLLGQLLTAATTHEPQPLRLIIPGVIFYALVAVALIWFGIGSCKARRWARALSLTLAWSWLAIGVVTMAAMAFLLPDIFNAAQPQGRALPESARLAVLLVTMLFTGALFVAVPAVLVVFYASRHVRATCEARDPVARWTDACPLPVLGLGLWVGLGAVALLAMPLSTRGVLPVFGVLLTGLGGALCCVVLAAVWGYGAWAIYRRRTVGWWIVFVSVCAWAASGAVTLARIDLLEMYRAMGYPEHQIRMMEQFSFVHGPAMAYLAVGGAVPFVGFLLFVRRYF